MTNAGVHNGDITLERRPWSSAVSMGRDGGVRYWCS